MKTLLCTIAILVAGCTTWGYVWTKPGATEFTYQADRGACQAKASDGAAFVSRALINGPPAELDSMQDKCMEGRGWTKQFQGH
jgi:hypothetical protein